MVGEALHTRLNEAHGFTWLGQVGDASHLSDQARQRHPDIILMDLEMPGLDPFDAMRALNQTYPHARIVVLSGHVRSDLIDHAIESGAWGYLAKDDDARTILSAIERVAHGEFVISPHAAREYRI
ncbi:MAG: response regulator transcription factor [Phycisphaerales bacterium]|nr:response regulator transcription factor [Phycisphaerales bacterium]MCI0629262.1 response regulator transcription factor [Phycisphaerales bacterium]MCI0674456.1 response regulator transcription factor [Phycisphaerales bacterium]